MHPFETNAPSLSRTALENTELLSGKYWGELRTFLAVAKTRSLKSAAENLGVSHMTVARQIRRLQDVLGAQLVVVTKTGTKLNIRGEALANALLDLDRRLYSLAIEASAEARGLDGVVRLSVTDGLSAVFLAPALSSFSQRFPNIQVHVKRPGSFKNLRDNQTDIMVGFGDDPGSDICAQPLGYLHLLPVASQTYIDRMGLPTEEQISHHEFIDSEQYSARASVWDRWHDLVSRGRVKHCCDTSISYGMMVKAGLGIGLLGNYTLAEPTAVPLELGLGISIRLYALAIRDRLESKPVKAVYDLVSEVFGPNQNLFSESYQVERLQSEQRASISPILSSLVLTQRER
jgi:DNA-binding transcriptional LysR family regulator